ncbi:MAG: hypothetical protein AB1505_18340 [Candidatus Latescibacterota bacterium]
MSAPVLSCALLADGSTDRALVPILEWSIHGHRPELAVRMAGFRVRGGTKVPEAMEEAARTFAPDILFVHRDAEGLGLERRLAEIPITGGKVVRVVPVRMTEAWLLVDEAAIRTASGNPNGRSPLALPPSTDLEGIADPKGVLRELLMAASGHSTRRKLKRLRRDLPLRVQRVASLVRDYGPLRALPAYRAFCEELSRVLDRVRPPAPPVQA